MTINDAIGTIKAMIICDLPQLEEAIGIAVECMERCKRIDDEELKFVCGFDEYAVGWNDCLMWVKEGENGKH